VSAIALSKVEAVLHGFSVPNFPWRASPRTIDHTGMVYLPGSLACMALIYYAFVRFFPLFPHLEKAATVRRGARLSLITVTAKNPAAKRGFLRHGGLPSDEWKSMRFLPMGGRRIKPPSEWSKPVNPSGNYDLPCVFQLRRDGNNHVLRLPPPHRGAGYPEISCLP
jgi:hypothetical protein